mgnify:CR=1 FL=1|tara:strand:- start:4957 stop:5523 length:567 start_codon:yes stop_codon:yes gene_type:complete
MILIGITGLVASGKSKFSSYIAGKKYPLFSADKIVQKLYKQNNFKSKLKKTFKLKNQINLKKQMMEILSKDKNQFKKLEILIHPLVRQQMIKFIKNNKKVKIKILEIPLLIESKLYHYFDSIVFINSKKEIRLKRFISRGGNKLIFNILDKRQFKTAHKTSFCDYIVNNNKDLRFLKNKAKSIIKFHE